MPHSSISDRSTCRHLGTVKWNFFLSNPEHFGFSDMLQNNKQSQNISKLLIHKRRTKMCSNWEISKNTASQRCVELKWLENINPVSALVSTEQAPGHEGYIYSLYYTGLMTGCWQSCIIRFVSDTHIHVPSFTVCDKTYQNLNNYS